MKYQLLIVVLLGLALGTAGLARITSLGHGQASLIKKTTTDPCA